MFLFTTPSSPRDAGPAAAGPRAGGGPVVAAIRDGAQASGAGFDYLLATAQRESALDPAAKAATSSATGLFQFIEQTWLGTMKTAGPKLGLGSYAEAIAARGDGTYTVADPAQRQAILDLRRDPKIAATLAGALTQKNGEALSAAIGREPTAGDLYAAHVLGARGAANLIAAARETPERAAALALPEAAAANRSLFYDRSGRARSNAELYAVLSAAPKLAAAAQAAGGDAAALPQVASQVAPQTASGFASTLPSGDLRSLFQTDRRGGAISEGVARLWQGRGAEAARPAPSYFPRSDGSAGTAAAEGPTAAEPAVPPAGAVIADPPLPPRRPAALTPAALSAQAGGAYASSTRLATRSGP